MTDSPPVFSLTSAEIARWYEDRAECDREIDRFNQKKLEIDERLRAAQLLAPTLFSLAQPQKATGRGQATVRKGLLTWTRIIDEAVQSSGSGLRQRDLLGSIRSGRHGKRLNDSESGYYNAIAKVLKRGSVIKRGEWLFTPAQLEEYLRKVEAGEITDCADEATFGSASAAAAMRFATSNPGSKSIDIIRHIWEVQKASGETPQSKTSLYNVLARLTEQNRLMKDSEGGYRPYKETEAPSGDAVGASEAGEVAASPIENQPSLRLVS